jgi:hypothetical protein
MSRAVLGAPALPGQPGNLALIDCSEKLKCDQFWLRLRLLHEIAGVFVFTNPLYFAQSLQHFVRRHGRKDPFSYGVGYGANRKQRSGHAVADA